MCLGEGCAHGELQRRNFLIGGAAAVIGLGAHATDRTASQQEPPPTRVLDDPSIQHGTITFTHDGKPTIDGFLARPKHDRPAPGVLVIAGNRITEEYIPNTCAALAVAGFVGLAPNIFHPLTDAAQTMEEINEAMKNHTEVDALEDIQAGADHLHAQPFVRAGGLGIVGFCSGGRKALLFAARSREIAAVVPFHPAPMEEREVALVEAPVQLHHGTGDQVSNVSVSKKIAEVLEAQGTPVELHLYEGADHGFLAYTRPYYRPDDALLAWERVVEFLEKHLKP